MSDRTARGWLMWPLITSFLAAVLIFLLMYEQPSHVKDNSQYRNANPSNNYASKSASDYQSVTFGWRLRQAFSALAGDPTQAPKVDPDCNRECQRAEQDLGAQLDMAFWGEHDDLGEHLNNRCDWRWRVFCCSNFESHQHRCESHTQRRPGSTRCQQHPARANQGWTVG